MRIAIIGGTGYVGLTTAVCLATRGHLVFCVGRNEEKVEKIQVDFPEANPRLCFARYLKTI